MFAKLSVPGERFQRREAAAGVDRCKFVESGEVDGDKPNFGSGKTVQGPHKAAGIRVDPPVSVPMPATAMPSATETAAPEDEPPGIRRLERS